VIKQRKKMLAALVFGVLSVAGVVGTAIAADSKNQKDKVAAGEPEVKQLLLLMDADKNGKVSKQEFMRFMEAEFDRLDKDKSGELDVKELTQLQIRPIGHSR